MKPEIKTAIDKLVKAGWTRSKSKITKKFMFKDFNEAYAFMTRCALSIAILDHHPEWKNVYNKVEVGLTTHDAGGVTAKDVELAKIMDKVFSKFSVKG